ncbi:S8 family serine peptidase [Stieleria sp. ICT_E10.1]|uniref:S8 family serine peptidase n=1 Tax=Stieleria sedimenti TaxID=2976331 RepID=UPI00217F623B|nr:S8 family serine peptidase [Stieleria sedimenti]MCS7470455.1 S8 family serine peptidase [Stieleria sedimenti]
MHLERLESRFLLAGDFGGTTEQPPPESPAPITWFESFDDVPRIELESLAAVDAVYPDGFQGPRELAAGEWILQLTDSVAGRVHVLQTADQHLDEGTIEFTIIAGLGAEGLVLVRGEGVTAADIEASLERSDSVESFSLNSIIRGQATAPNDSDYTPGLLAGLTTIGAEAAWDESTGSMQTVVGVVDSGIDLDHPDLYLNIWLNQGEIPSTFKGDLVDIDGDGLITFYDLNNLHVIDGSIYVASTVVLDGSNNFVSGDLATEAQLTTATPYAEGANAAYVRDLVGDRSSVNGRIDPVDLLFDPLWSDGRDTDQNGFFDDFFGVNFRSGGEDPFSPNQPDDVLGHGTHVAGTIGAVGNNHTGVVGVNWQTSLMSLRILDNNNRSDAGSGLRAVNYAKMMRERHEVDVNNREVQGANVRVLNNSWGQPGGYEPAFETAIGELADEGILFVAAAGNGDIFGNGVDNDQTPFYPSSYDVDNVIAVAASTLVGGLASFSNYGRTTVDIAAPGTGIRSTLKGGGYGTANGTSMATPHVAGAAALIWSSQPQGAVGEIRAALLDAASVEPLENGDQLVSSGGRLSASGAIAADVFAPSARVTQKQSIATSGGKSTEFTVRYRHRDGIDLDSIDDNDVIVTRQWGPADAIPVSYKPGSKSATADGAVATYVMEAPGGGSFTNSTNVVIQSDAPNTVSSQIWVDDLSGLPSALTVTVNIRHTSVSDLTVTLIAPDGARATLVSGRGGSADDIVASTFDDNADTSIVEATAPFTGTFQPEQSLASLLTSNVNGAWTLEIDDAASLDGGLLENWTLDVAPQWDPLDYGEYRISTVAGGVNTTTGGLSTETRLAGSFDVRITDDPSILYVDSFVDSLAAGSLRSAILDANAAAPAGRTILLEPGIYTIDLPPVVDPESSFAASIETLGLENPGGWSNADTGDFDVMGNLKIIGGIDDTTIIDARGHDRVFKLYPQGQLTLERLTIQGGVSPASQGGGGVLSLGDLHLDSVIARENGVRNAEGSDSTFGGAIAAWSGQASIRQSWLTGNQADFGGGVFYGETAGGEIQRSTFDHNQGGGVHALVGVSRRIENSTFSANLGGLAVIATAPPDGILTANDQSNNPSISGDGRYVAFESRASNLVPGDTNGVRDVFVYDRTEGTIERVSLGGDATQGNGHSSRPSISGDGRFVAFTSRASNLVPGDTNDWGDVFVYDRTEATIERVSTSGDATQGNEESAAPSISSDGRYVAFGSWASNLVPGDTNDSADVFVYDRAEGTIQCVSLGAGASEGNGDSWSPSISADGRYVAFESDASNIVPGDTNGSYDIFVYDRTEGTIQRISTAGDASEANGHSFSPSISDDGRSVAFESRASNLFPGDTNGSSDVFVYDRNEDTIERVSRGGDTTEGNDWSEAPSISGDGHFVAFVSLANNLVPGDTNDARDIFVYDRTEGTVERVSLDGNATEGNGDSWSPSISSEGRFVAFESGASNLFPGDTNGAADVFVHDRPTDGIQALTFNTPEPLTDVSDVSHVTIAHSGVTGSNHSIVGDVRVANTLFTLNNVTFDLDDRSGLLSSQNIFSTSPGSDLILPLTRVDDAPPVHPLVLGNPAIDWRAPSTRTTLDQLGQTRPLSADAGAVEATNASVVATVYVDHNQNGRQDTGEEGISDFEVQLSTPQTSVLFSPDTEGKVEINGIQPGQHALSVDVDSGRPWSAFVPPIDWAQSRSLQPNGASWSVDLSSDGRYMAFESNADNLVPGDTNEMGDIFVYDRTERTIERVSLSADATEGNGMSSNASISGDGRFVAFESNASNLVTGDTNGGKDVFVYDRIERTIERVSGNGSSSRPSISADGRYMAFESGASDLVPGDTNGTGDVFVYDCADGTIERVSLGGDAMQGNAGSWNSSISGDGRYVAFESDASNLVPGDTNGVGDVFVYDRIEGTIERVSRGDDAAEGNGRSRAASLSGDGRFVAFGSESSNLVPGDTNGVGDGFVYDRFEGTIERVSLGGDASEGNGWSYPPSISWDGRYVAFSSWASNLVPGDTNSWGDIFVHDRTEGTIERISLGRDATEGDGFSYAPSISDDGRYVAFESDAGNLVPGDTNGLTDTFLAHSPLVTPAATLNLRPGEILTDLDLGVVPDPGRVSGRIYQDVVANGVYDPGEPVGMNTVVFLDLNFNQQFDVGEPTATLNAEGLYEFAEVDAHVSYSILATLPSGFQQVAPDADGNFEWEIFLPAGGDVTNRNFGFRRVQATGQSTSSIVSGRLFEDTNGSGLFEQGIDVSHGNIPIYLDANNNRRHNIGSNEPITLTNADGTYAIDGLSSRIVTLRTSLNDGFVHTTPLGNSFDLETSRLLSGLVAFDTASAATPSDFNLDGFEDLAVLISDGNLLAIRLNDRQGGFSPSEINIPLGTTETMPGTSLPLEMVVGQFNRDAAGKKDVAIVGQSAGNVLILLDFDEDTNQFLSQQAVDVGENPVSLTSGLFDAGTTLDLAVLNAGTSQLVQASPPVYTKINESFQILTNDGNGTFTAQAAVPVPGDDPVAIVSDDFNGDDIVDFAVLHNSPTLPNTPFGDVALFTGDGAGVFALSHRELVEGGPLEMVSGDFNGDGIADLAVANVSQNTLSILAGRADGVIIRETAHPIGTGEKGIDSMDVADIDNDGDLDIVATRLSDGGVSIFRNITDIAADPPAIRFEPLESFGVAQASVFERAPIVLANFDNDVSGPGGEGTVDIVAIPKSTATVNIMMNTLVDGGHRVALDGLNTISDLDFIITPTGDVVPPSVTDVRIAASGWATSFKSAVDPQNLRGVEVPGPSPLRPLSWNGLDTLFVEFSEDIQKTTGAPMDAADLTLNGVNVPDYATAPEFGITTSYTNGGGEGPFLLTIQLAGAADFGADRVVLGLGDSIVDLAGNPLGGNSIFGFNVLPGDVDGSGGVLANDVLTVNVSQFTFAGAVGYDAFRDIDGSGAVFANDVLLANGRQFTFLPPESPAAPPTLDPGSVDEFFESITSDGEGELAAEPGIKLFCNSEPNA